MLYTRVWGSGDPLVLVHGFTQSSAGWGSIGDTLAGDHLVVAVDAPGHGRSGDVAADLPGGADLMAVAVRREVGGTPADWLGYSMGGRYCLHVALEHRAAVRSLVLVSATGGLDDAGERAARRAGDEARADRLERIGVEAFLAEWLSQPLFATLPPEAADLESRLQASPAGLASSLRLAGTGAQEPLWDRLAGLDMPVLVVAGALDTKFVGLGRRLVEAIGHNARLELIDGAGHACHLERPGHFLEVVTDFLAGG